MFRSVVVAVVAVLASGSALAQKAPANPAQIKPATQPAPATTIKPNTTVHTGEPGVITRAVGGESFTVTSRAPSGGERRTEVGPRGAAALQAFSFEFLNGDHSIKTIKASRRDGETALNFADNDGNDPYTASATYLPLVPGFEVRRVSKTCVEYCFMGDGVPKDQVLVLTGFSFERQGTDADIVDFSIIPYPQYGQFEIEFGDSNERLRIMDIQIEYVSIPRELVGERSLCISTSACASGAGPQNKVIEGFACRYGVGKSANLLAAAIDARSAPGGARFQDNDTDEAGRCRVMIASLK